MIERHLAKLRFRDEISADEEQAIRSSVSEVREYPGDFTVIRAGEEVDHSCLLLDGVMCRHKDLLDGQRQATELHVPGDFADLHSFTLKRLDHDVSTLSRCRIAIVPHERLRAITEQHPHLTRVYWFATNLDAAIHREWQLSLGRRNARMRTAALFCELHIRLQIVGLADEQGYDLNLTQADLAEFLGLTVVHVNRTLKELREERLVEFQRGRVTLADLPRLRQAAEFDPTYLYLERRAR